MPGGLNANRRAGTDVWRLEKVVVTTHGEKRYLWRAVDQDGYVLDEIIQACRNAKAAGAC
jgi:putative transposase